MAAVNSAQDAQRAEQATVVELRMQGLTIPQIAKQVDLTGSRVRTILYKARKAEGATGPLTEIAAREAECRARRTTERRAKTVALRIQGLTIQVIAEQLNTSNASVIAILNDVLKAENGAGPLTAAMTQRRARRARIEAKILELRLQGMAIPEIAEKVDLTGSTVDGILYKARKVEGLTGPLEKIAAGEAEQRARPVAERRARVIELRIQGLTTGEIAERVDLTSSRVRMILTEAREAEGTSGPLTDADADRAAKKRKSVAERRATAVALRDQGLSYSKIAKQLDMSIGGVRKTLSRALEAGSPSS